MKKLTVLLALVAFTFVASAQQMHLQSAISYFNKKYLNKAQEEIDLAVTSDKNVDSKTYFYKAKIYISIGQFPTNPNGFKWKGDIPADWRDQAYNAALECKRLDEAKEWSDQNNALINILGIEYSNAAVDFYNNADYAKAMQLFENSIKMFNESGNSKSSNDSYYYAGICATGLHDTANIIKNFNTLVRKKTDKEKVYKTLVEVYKAKGQNDEAFKIANSYVKNCPKDYNAHILLAGAYIQNQNIEKAKESLAQAEALTKDTPKIYAEVLCLEGGVIAEGGDIAGAEEKYKESLAMVPNQFNANFGIASMLYNKAIDKQKAAEKVEPIDDESTELMNTLTEESNALYGQTEPYLRAAIAYIDGITDENAKAMQKANLHSCLIALNQALVRLERYEDAKAVKTRIEQIEKGN